MYTVDIFKNVVTTAISAGVGAHQNFLNTSLFFRHPILGENVIWNVHLVSKGLLHMPHLRVCLVI